MRWLKAGRLRQAVCDQQCRILPNVEEGKRERGSEDRVAENALIAAAGRLTGTKPAAGADCRPVGMENCGRPGEIRTLVSGSRARHP